MASNVLWMACFYCSVHFFGYCDSHSMNNKTKKYFKNEGENYSSVNNFDMPMLIDDMSKVKLK